MLVSNLMAKITNGDARLAGAGCEEFVYLVVEALSGVGLQVDFRATRERKRRGEPIALLVTGEQEMIYQIADEIGRISGVKPTVSAVSYGGFDQSSRAALVSLS